MTDYTCLSGGSVYTGGTPPSKGDIVKICADLGRLLGGTWVPEPISEGGVERVYEGGRGYKSVRFGGSSWPFITEAWVGTDIAPVTQTFAEIVLNYKASGGAKWTKAESKIVKETLCRHGFSSKRVKNTGKRMRFDEVQDVEF